MNEFIRIAFKVSGSVSKRITRMTAALEDNRPARDRFRLGVSF